MVKLHTDRAPHSRIRARQTEAPVIVQYGLDRALLETRAKVLEMTGCAVVSVENARDVDRLLRTHHRGLLVVCHSVPAQPRDEMLHKLSLQSPAMKGLLVTRCTATCTDCADVVCNCEGPRALLLKAKHLLSARGVVAPPSPFLSSCIRLSAIQ